MCNITPAKPVIRPILFAPTKLSERCAEKRWFCAYIWEKDCWWWSIKRQEICKPYIFHRADLVNTEIIITIFTNPLIKSVQSVVTYEGRFIPCCSLYRSSNTEGRYIKQLCNSPIFNKAVKFLPTFSLYIMERLLLAEQIFFVQTSLSSKPPYTLSPTVPTQPLCMSYNNSYKLLNWPEKSALS